MAREGGVGWESVGRQFGQLGAGGSRLVNGGWGGVGWGVSCRVAGGRRGGTCAALPPAEIKGSNDETGGGCEERYWRLTDCVSAAAPGTLLWSLVGRSVGRSVGGESSLLLAA